MKNTLHGRINQRGITFGPRKLSIMRKACELMKVPLTSLNVNEENITQNRTFHVKLFDPCSAWTWYIQDWDGKDICFGWVIGFEKEWGSFSLEEISQVKGVLGLGIEADEHFEPKSTKEIIDLINTADI